MKSDESRRYRFGVHELDGPRRLLSTSAGPIAITGRAFDLLLYLIENGERVVPKPELMDAVWKDVVVEENNLTQTISTLRKALGDTPDEPRFIVTVPGRGYRFIAPITPARVEPPPPAQPPSRSRRRNTWLALAVLALIGCAAVGIYLRSIESAINAIAVLPFRPLLPEPRDAALELGMADTLILRLSNGRVVVRPLSAVRRYTGIEQDARTAGRELGVDAVLDGSISRSGDSVRVTARLIRVADGAALWGGQFDERWSNVFSVQDNIAAQVAAALELRLTRTQRQRLTRRDTKDDEAYRLYLLGRYHWSRLVPPDIYQSIDYFRQALTRDPNYALAYAGLAESYRALAISADVRPTDTLPQAKAAALTALRLDPALHEARATVCFISVWFDWNWPVAEQECKHALEVNPGSSEAHRAYSILLSDLGRHDEAIREARRSRELDPRSLVTNALEAHVLLYAGRTQEAVQRTDAILALDPKFWIAWLFRGKALLKLGKLPEALSAFEKARDFSNGNSEAWSLIGYTLAVSGRPDDARAVLGQLLTRASNQYVPPFNIAMIYNGLGRKGETFDWLDRAYADRDVRLTFLRIENKWDPLRAEPRFVSLAQRMKLD
jgi:DNA-binding winged helix-turn-helix (wHTH) protein/TolB-like protein/Flp pilus assembly protein TadD